MSVDLNILSLSACFNGIAKADIAGLAARFSTRAADAGEMLSLEGETSDALYLLAAGTARLLKTSVDGKEQTLQVIRPVNTINELAVMDGLPNPYSAEAVDKVMLYVIPRADLIQLVRENARINANFIDIIAARARHLADLVEDLSFRTVSGRVAKILLESVLGEPGEHRRLTQREMAAMAGTAREVVGRSLKFLEDSGAIRFDRHRLIISDKDTLEDIAGVSAI